MSDGRVEFDIVANKKGAEDAIEQVTEELKRNGQQWEKDAEKSTDSISDSFSGMLKKIAAGFSAAKIGQMLLNLGKDAIQAASDLEEVQNVVDVTFGADANKIESWAKNAGEQFGLTETQAKRFTSTLGAMMKSAGLTGSQIADMSTDMAGLAADMASFYNLDFDTAFDKIRAGISGETEPLKQLGINMSVANLNAYALQQGLSKTFDQMSQGEQVMLRYQYLMRATSDAQGDFSRTSDGYANSLRTLETNIESLKTKLGEVLLPVISDVVSGINDMVSALTQEKQRTVLDDFADIDLKTSEKIAAVKTTAEQARTTLEVLEQIGTQIGTNKTDAGKMLDEIPTGENNNVNSILTQLEKIEEKANNGQTAIGSIISSVPTGETVSRKFENVLDELDGVTGDAEDTQGAIGSILDTAPNDSKTEKAFGSVITGLNGVIEKTGEGQTAITGLVDGSDVLNKVSETMTGVKDTAGEAQAKMNPLVDATGEMSEENRQWLEGCKQLVEILPGLSGIINTETGEIKGGTAAVRAYIDAWEEAQKWSILQSAHEQKVSALQSKQAELWALDFDVTVAEGKVRKARDQLNSILKKYGINEDADSIGWFAAGSAQATDYGLDYESANLISKEITYYRNLKGELKEVTDERNRQQEAFDIATEQIKYEGEVIEQEHKKAAEAAGEWGEEEKEAARTAVSSLKETLTELEDYAKGVHDAVLSSINSTIKSFEKIQTPAQKAMESGTGEIATAQSMLEGLNSQLAFMEKYTKDLEAARQRGISNEVLASLSDGSVESADYLSALANATDEQVKEINEKYKAVQEGKESLATTLSQQKLTVDETYQAMYEKAKEAVKNLDLAGEAAENSGKTIAGIAQGISDHVPDVSSAVDEIVAQLDRLNGYGIDLDFGVFGTVHIDTTTPSGSHLSGLANVPYDGYLAELHQGEAILTQQENRIWRDYKAGMQNNTDYDRLGSIMRENVQAGGNVYLDGKTVGQVISDRQGAQYRTLTRSGWQNGNS
ncbi:MAG: hypothetical protein J6P40_02680 [Oscillospiraceae bacterium]|nr:hypothetical protein [Oscillospiraceae bacterium]